LRRQVAIEKPQDLAKTRGARFDTLKVSSDAGKEA